MPDPAPAATPAELLARAAAATLATLSKRHPGWPAASFVPFALDADGSPLVLLSALAEHTANPLGERLRRRAVALAGRAREGIAAAALRPGAEASPSV
jgi:hypothetical protein